MSEVRSSFPGVGDGASIRAAQKADIGAVLDLWRGAGAVSSTTDDPDGLSLLLDTDRDALLVAEYDGAIVGALVAAFDGWRGNMYRLAVLPAYRRCGVALALVAEGERRLCERGARRITALVAHEQAGAVEFWEAAGYDVDLHTTRFVKTL